MKIGKIMRRAIVLAVALLGLSLAFASASYAADIDGKWNLVRLVEYEIPKERPIAAEIESKGKLIKMIGLATCNAYAAFFWSGSPGSIKLNSEFWTGGSYCDYYDEDTYFDVLKSVDSYKVSGNSLILSSGKENLEFVKASEEGKA